MRQAQGTRTAASVPALIVTYGNTPQKLRPLDRAVFLIGRSQTCDLTVASPEIAPVHCIIAQVPQGWLLRNCSGHVSTRLNGSTVQEQMLRNGDVLQVGVFTFRVSLPTDLHDAPAVPDAERTPSGDLAPSSRETQRQESRRTAAVDGEGDGVPAPRRSRNSIDLGHLEHLRRSRRNLCRLALLMRDRLGRAQEELARVRQDYLERREDLDIKEEELRELEEELNSRQDALTRDESYLESRATRLEKEVSQRQKEADARIEAAWQDLQARCKREEELHRLRLRQVAEPSSGPEGQEQARRLAIRKLELDHLASHLRRCLQAAHAEAPAAGPPGGDRGADLARRLEQAEEKVQSQEREIERLRAALEHFADHPPAMSEHCQPDASEQEQQCQQLRDLLAEAQARIAALEQREQAEAAAPEDLVRMLELRADDLEAQLRARQDEMQALLRRSEEREEEMAQRLRALNDEAHELSDRLRQREGELEEIRMERDDWQMEVNLEHSGGYERELHRFRLELERDRATLAEQIAQVAAREEEVEEASRRAELEMSRERALLARERADLLRLRDDIRLDRDRLQREGELRGKLADVKALKGRHGPQG